MKFDDKVGEIKRELKALRSAGNNRERIGYLQNKLNVLQNDRK